MFVAPPAPRYHPPRQDQRAHRSVLIHSCGSQTSFHTEQHHVRTLTSPLAPSGPCRDLSSLLLTAAINSIGSPVPTRVDHTTLPSSLLNSTSPGASQSQVSQLIPMSFVSGWLRILPTHAEYSGSTSPPSPTLLLRWHVSRHVLVNSASDCFPLERVWHSNTFCHTIADGMVVLGYHHGPEYLFCARAFHGEACNLGNQRRILVM